MRKGFEVLASLLFVLLPGCAHIDFGGDGLTYYDSKPYLFVSTTKDCVTTATVVSIPETKKVMKFVSGFGSADLSASFSNGMISTVGQKTDTKIPETISAVASLGTAVAGFKILGEPEKRVICTPTAKLYSVTNGLPEEDHPIAFEIRKEIIDTGSPQK